MFVIFTGAAAVFEFVTLPFDGTFSKFITLYLIWLVSSYIVGWFIEEKMKNDEMDTTGSFVLDALIWFNVLNYKFINRFVFRRKNRNNRNAAR
ncbi:hypothetical protein CYJ36_00705 [Bacillus sp. UMB0893]|nr:hypothetical protein CYJ36_00705 [Bacillus sp. UMB0893]